VAKAVTLAQTLDVNSRFTHSLGAACPGTFLDNIGNRRLHSLEICDSTG
jgi:hypothetical protein